MADLLSYRQQVSRLCGDVTGALFNPFDLDIYINLARGQVASEGQCVRRLLPASTGLADVAPTVFGSGYTTATVSVNPPDIPGVQATVTANIVGGMITSYTITQAGSGYYFPPLVTVTGDGSGATATATLQYASHVVENQTILDLSAVPVSSIFPGVSQILAALSIAIIWQNVRYTGNRVSFSKFQSIVASYTAGNFLYTPFWWAQYGQGTDLTFYLYPQPDQTYPVEVDCICVPLDLEPDGSVPETIPYPFTDAVPFYAAWMALQTLADPARMPLADRYFRELSDGRTGGIYTLMMKRARAFAQPSVVSSWYGRNLS